MDLHALCRGIGEDWQDVEDLAKVAELRRDPEVAVWAEADVRGASEDDIQGLAAELFRDEYLRLALIGPHDDEREFAELLHLP
jgi:hypothetical protein